MVYAGYYIKTSPTVENVIKQVIEDQKAQLEELRTQMRDLAPRVPFTYGTNHPNECVEDITFGNKVAGIAPFHVARTPCDVLRPKNRHCYIKLTAE